MKKGTAFVVQKIKKKGQKARTLRGIELSEYLDYGPADSDTSVADFSDSERDSEDDAFIDDGGPFFFMD